MTNSQNNEIIYKLNQTIKCSPPFNNRITIYFGDRNTTVDISIDEWRLIHALASQTIDINDLYSSVLPYIDRNRFPDLPSYSQWLLRSGIIISENPKSFAGNQQEEKKIYTKVSASSANNDLESNNRIALIDFKSLFENFNVIIPPSFVNRQILLWPFSVSLFFLSIYLFYFAPTAIGPTLSQDSNPLAGIAKLLTLFLVVGFVGTLFPIIASVALGINDTKLYFKTNLGFIPTFSKDTTFPEYFTKASKKQRLFLICQPILAKMYLATFSIFTILIYLRIPSLSQGWISSIFLTTIQISLFSIFFDALPIGNTTGTKFLALRGVIPKGILPIARKRVKDIFHNLRKGQYHKIKHLWSLFYILTFALVLIFKLSILLLFIVPSLSSELPLFLGYWTPFFVRTALLLVVVRFLILRFTPQLSSGVQINTSSFQNSPPYGNPNNIVSNTKLRNIIPHDIAAFVKSRRSLLLLILFILFLPFPATISASASVVESKDLDIRATESSVIVGVHSQGPSEKKLPKGFTLITLASPELEAALEATKQEILNLDSKIRAAQITIKSLESGSVVESVKSRDDELTIAIEDVDRYKGEVSSIEAQLKLTQDTIKSYEFLLDSGAVSELQLRNYLIIREDLFRQLVAAKSNLSSAKAKTNKARRNKLVDQNIKLNEDLLQAYEALESSSTKREQAIISLKTIEDRLDKLRVQIPFDGVVSSDTAGLMDRSVVVGETIATVKSLPLSNVVSLVPDYDRSKLKLAMKCAVRLYPDSYREFTGVVASISPSTVTQDSLKYLEVSIDIKDDLPSNYIGTIGYAKITYGTTFLLRNMLEPVLRFINLDVWSVLP